MAIPSRRPFPIEFNSLFQDRLERRKSAMAEIRPLHDRVIVRRIDASENKTSGGLFIPDSAKEKPQEGEVVAVGKGKLLENGSRVEPDVKAGDRVLFGKYSGTEVKLDGEELLIMREDEILGIIERAGKSAKGTK